MMMSLFVSDMLQTKTYIFLVLWPITVELGIWGHILLLICHIALKKGKTRHGSSMFTFSYTNLQLLVIISMKEHRVPEYHVLERKFIALLE